MNKAPLMAALIGAGLATAPSLAHEGHDHTPPPPAPAKATDKDKDEHPSPHGGQVIVLDATDHLHAELVFTEAGIALYLYDKDMKPLPPPADAKATVMVGKEVRKLELAVDAKTPDHAAVTTPLPKDAKVAVVLSATVGGKARSARVERAAPAMAYHSHESAHGGMVMMSGDDHAELVADPGGGYRLWFTDAWRKPLPGEQRATLTVKSKGGEVETIVMTAGPDGAMVGKGKAKDGQARTVILDGFAHGFPFKTQWEIAAK